MATVLEKVGTSAGARLLGISEQRLRQLADAGAIPCEATVLGRLFAVDDLHRFAAEREQRRREQVRSRQVRA